MNDQKDKFYTARGYELADKAGLTPSMEDYIEMIYRISQETGYTRVNDVAEQLNVQPPSVTKMVQKLHDKSLLRYEKYGMIHLTEAGEKLGRFFLRRHNVLKDFFALLGIKQELHKDVEQIEHYFDGTGLQIIEDFVNFIKDNQEILQQFRAYRQCKDQDS